jgi:hypothetical protein
LRGAAATEDADAGRQRGRGAERKLVRREEEHHCLPAATDAVAPNTPRPVVEHAVVVVVASGQEGVGRCGAAVDAERNENVSNHLVVEVDVDAAANIGGGGLLRPSKRKERPADSRRARCRSPFVPQIAGGRNAEGTVGVVLER